MVKLARLLGSGVIVQPVWAVCIPARGLLPSGRKGDARVMTLREFLHALWPVTASALRPSTSSGHLSSEPEEPIVR